MHVQALKVIYVTNARIPTEWAHSLQIMKTCEALVAAGISLELWTPAKKLYIKESPFSYYAVTRVFPIRRFFTLDWTWLGKAGFLVQTFSFALSVLFALLGEKGKRTIYCRDEMVVALLTFFGVRSIVWESHDGVWNRWAKYAANHASALVTVSKGLKDFYVENGVSAEMISVIPNGIDLTAFANPQSKEVARTRLGLPQDKNVALYIGMLEGWKGTDTLLKAADILGSEVLVVVIGGESDVQVETLRMQHPRVLFLGFLPQRDLADNQSVADVLILPNTGKNQIAVRFSSPLKLLSYMASGKPIIASDLPSIREIVNDDSAYLVLPDDPEVLANSIREVLAHPQVAAARAVRAREQVERYTWTNRALSISTLIGHLNSQV